MIGETKQSFPDGAWVFRVPLPGFVFETATSSLSPVLFWFGYVALLALGLTSAWVDFPVPGGWLIIAAVILIWIPTRRRKHQ